MSKATKLLPLIFIACFLLILFLINFYPDSKLIEVDLKVEPDFEAKRIADACNVAHKNTCYEEGLAELAKTHGLNLAENTLYALWDFDKSTRNCHLLAHVIGTAAAQANPEKSEQYLEEVDISTCAAGFLHGVLEIYVDYENNFKFDSQFINKICLKDNYNYYRKQTCVHYMGHLLMFDTDGDVDSALKECAGVEEKLDKRCFTGVFMEDAYPIALVEHKIRDRLPNRHNPEITNKQTETCLKYQGDRAVACWITISENFVIFYSDPQKVYDECNKAPFATAGKECFLKAAVIFAAGPNYATAEKLVSVCSPVKDSQDLYRQCVTKMVSSLLYRSPKFTQRAVLLCNNIDYSYRDFCFAEIKKKINKIVQEFGVDKKQFCQKLSSEYGHLCLN